MTRIIVALRLSTRRSIPTTNLPTEIQSKRCWRNSRSSAGLATSCDTTASDTANETMTDADASQPAQRPRRLPQKRLIAAVTSGSAGINQRAAFGWLTIAVPERRRRRRCDAVGRSRR